MPSTDPTPLDELVATLYTLEPDEFVSARSKAAARVKAAGDEIAAARLRKLPKPTIAAYWVNQLALHWPAELRSLLQVGAELREATLARDRNRLTTLDRTRRIRTDALMSLLWHHGEDQARGGGRKPSQDSLTRVLETLTAAVMDADVAADVREGRLAKTVVHEGFAILDFDDDEDEDGGSENATITQLPVRGGLRLAHPSSGPPSGLAHERAIQRATADLVDAENDFTAARDTVDSLSRMLDVLEQELVAMTRDRDSTRTNIATWKRRLRDAERASRVARSRLDVLTKGDPT